MQTNLFISTKLLIAIISFLIILASLTSCTSRIETRGNLPNDDMLANIEVGQVSMREVVELIGSPSTIEPFQGQSWYYISEKTSAKAFFEPEITSRKVIIIRFDNKGIVKEIKTIGLKEAKNIKMVERITPTAGREMTILRQLFGNIGRFQGAGSDNLVPGG